MRVIPSCPSSEHWLTLMTCTICSYTPDNSPLYKCSLGHTICHKCFEKLISPGVPTCRVCKSKKFTKHEVSADFLRKLKTKPGIGRPKRYVFDAEQSLSVKDNDENSEEELTMEKLFQMSSTQIQQLFGESAKDIIRQHNNYAVKTESENNSNLKNEGCDEEVSVFQALGDTRNNVWLNKNWNDNSRSLLNLESGSTLQSRKPIKCPHNPCNKIIAVSSFQSHFKYDHFDFQRYTLERCKELSLPINTTQIQHDRTFCLAIIKLYEVSEKDDKNGNKEIDTFWVMVSGSTSTIPSQAYAIFWVLTNNDDTYNCTLDFSSQYDAETVSTFCSVNSIHESLKVMDIMQRSKCHYLTYGTLRSILGYGPKPNLRVAIH